MAATTLELVATIVWCAAMEPGIEMPLNFPVAVVIAVVPEPVVSPVNVIV